MLRIEVSLTEAEIKNIIKAKDVNISLKEKLLGKLQRLKDKDSPEVKTFFFDR